MYQVTVNSRNVLVPVSLEGRDGTRLDAPPSRLDTATAMVIAVSGAGTFSQEFIPLRIVTGSQEAYSGREWELRAQPAGRDHFVFYLGIPDAFFAAPAGGGPAPKSLSVEVVGSSGMTGREDYAGGVDISLQAEVALPLVPGFLGLVDRFFPPLLPHNFVAAYALARIDAAGRRDLVLMASLQADPAERPPVSFGKHWDPKNWIGAAVENLDPAGGGAYHVIRGGCFYGRNRRVTHWFGSGIGLEDRGFRQAASERIRELGASGQGAWVFWLEPQGRAAARSAILEGLEASRPQARFAVRHPMLHRLLARPSRRVAPSAGRPIASLPAESAVQALARAARILVDHSEEIHRARTEPAHALWSEEPMKTAAVQVADALAAAESGRAPAAGSAGAPLSSLESAVGELYRDEGEALRALESAFDESGGFAAWDAPGHPLRDLLAAYLEEGAEARSPA